MAHLQRREAAETREITDTVVSGVDSITDIGGGLIRIVFYINRRAKSGGLERVLLDETLVMPISMVADAIGKAMLAVGRKIVARPDGSLTVAH